MQKIIDGISLDFDEVLIRPKRSTINSRSEVDILRDYVFKYSPRKLSATPIIVANMDTTGTFAMAKTIRQMSGLVALHKHYDGKELIEFFSSSPQDTSSGTFYSLGTSSKDIEKLSHVFSELKNKQVELPNICVDVANGYSEKFVKTLANIRKAYPEPIIMAGNVVTDEMVEELVLHGGVDIVKIGIGPGAVCTTRLKTGVGYGQISACMECADAAHGLGAMICGDGGCKHVGDICKVLGTGADFVMLGSMFAGTDECDGEWTYEYKHATSTTEWWQSFSTGNEIETRK